MSFAAIGAAIGKIGVAIKTIIAKSGAFLTHVCTKAGTFIQTRIMPKAKVLIGKIVENGPQIVDVISNVVEKYVEGIRENEQPEDIGMKVEKSEQKAEDFDSTHEYLEYLRDEVPLDQAKVDELHLEENSPEWLSYFALGIALYLRDVSERKGISIDPEFLEAVVHSKMEIKEIVKLIDIMIDKKVNDTSEYVKSMKGEFAIGSEEQARMYDAIVEMYKECYPDLTNEEIAKLIYNLRKNVREAAKD